MSRGWLVVTGGLHRWGGQDRANLELVKHLAFDLGRPVTVVAHDVEENVETWPGVKLRLVRRPFGAFSLGDWMLENEAERARDALPPGTIVLGNGGNYRRADVTWVHSVHAAWPVRHQGAPLLRKTSARFAKWTARRRELRAVGNAKLLIANSRKTADDLRDSLGIPETRVMVLPFGAEPASGAPPEGTTGRIGFVGALGWDLNKGLDIALRAFARLTENDESRYHLIVAGLGSLERWQRQAEKLGITERVEFVGMVREVSSLMATFDILVSPVRYEAYGLAVQEALIAGVPAIVSSDAGIADLLLPTLSSLLVQRKEDPDAWVDAIRAALRDLENLRSSVAVLGKRLVARPWRSMAAELVQQVESSIPGGVLTEAR